MPEGDRERPLLSFTAPGSLDHTVLRRVVGSYGLISRLHVDRYTIWPIDTDAARWITSTLTLMGHPVHNHERDDSKE